MKKVRIFFRTVWKSATSPAYYKDIVEAPAGFSWKFFGAMQALVLLVLFPVLVTGLLIALVRVNLPQQAQTVAEYLPQDLVVKMTPTGLVVNQPLPYAIALPPVFASLNKEEQPKKHIVVFAHDAQVQSVASFSAYQSYAVLTETRALVHKDRGVEGMEVYDLPKEPWVVSSQEIRVAIHQALASPLVQRHLYIGIFLAIAVSVGLFLLPFFWIGLMIYFSVKVAGVAVFVFVVSALLRRWVFAGKTYTFTQMMQVAIHAQIPLFLVYTFLPILGIVRGHQPWWIHALVVIALLWHVARMSSSRAQTPKKKSVGRK